MNDLESVAARVQAEIGDEKPTEVEKPSQEAAESVEVQEASEAQPTDLVESEARARGWKPESEWHGNKAEWVDAQTFMGRAPLIEKIKDYGKELKGAKKTMEALAEQNRKLAKLLEDREINERMRARDEAIEAGDKDRVKALDREIDSVKQTFVPQPAVPDEVQTWAQSQGWFMQDSADYDPAAASAAVAYYGKLEKQNPADLSANLQKTTEYVKRRFPDLFPQETKPEVKPERRLSTVEAPTRATATTKRDKGFSELPEEAKKMAKDFERRGVMTRDEYAKQFFLVGG